MKKYTPRTTKQLPILTIISATILATGIVLIVVNFPNISLQVALTASGGLTSIIFLSSFFADKSRVMVVYEDRFVFPRGADKNGKLVFQKTVIESNEISSVESQLHKGDKIISGDCFFHTLKLKDGTKVTVTLYEYGREAEKEIIETSKKSIT